MGFKICVITLLVAGIISDFRVNSASIEVSHEHDAPSPLQNENENDTVIDETRPGDLADEIEHDEGQFNPELDPLNSSPAEVSPSNLDSSSSSVREKRHFWFKNYGRRYDNCYYRSCYWRNDGYWSHGYWYPNKRWHCEWVYNCYYR